MPLKPDDLRRFRAKHDLTQTEAGELLQNAGLTQTFRAWQNWEQEVTPVPEWLEYVLASVITPEKKS